MKNNIKALDVSILNHTGDSASYLLQEGNSCTLFDCGPQSQFEKLSSQLKANGLKPEDINNVVLSHIHLDHAGAAFEFAKRGAKIYVHKIGAPHLINTEKFYKSAQRIYREKMEEFWGEVKPCPADKVVVVEDKETITIGSKQLVAHYSPGHASHHIIWQLDDILFGGDTLGCKNSTAPIMASTPPPDIDFEAWINTVARIRKLKANRVFVTHFGDFELNDKYFDTLLYKIEVAKNLGLKMFEAGVTLNDLIFKIPDIIREEYDREYLNNPFPESYQMMSPEWMNCQGALVYWQLKNGQKPH